MNSTTFSPVISREKMASKAMPWWRRATKAFLDYYLKKEADGLKYLQASTTERGGPGTFHGDQNTPRKGTAIRFRGLPDRGAR